MRACLLVLAALALAGCEARQGAGPAPGLSIGGSLGAFGAFTR